MTAKNSLRSKDVIFCLYFLRFGIQRSNGCVFYGIAACRCVLFSLARNVILLAIRKTQNVLFESNIKELGKAEHNSHCNTAEAGSRIICNGNVSGEGMALSLMGGLQRGVRDVPFCPMATLAGEGRLAAPTKHLDDFSSIALMAG